MGNNSENNDDRMDGLIEHMKAKKAEWDAEGEEDETDALLSKALEMAISQGKGWKPGEKEAYLEKIMDDNYVHPLFATEEDDLGKSNGMAEAFSALMYDDPPGRMMLEAKKKGTEAFMNGKKNVAKNVQYYRDAINHYYESFHWAEKTVPGEPTVDSEGHVFEDIPILSKEELEEFKSTVLANAAMAHMQLKNWGFVRDDSIRALKYNNENIKALYRLAKAHQMLQNWEEAGDAIESGLAIDKENKELIKLQNLLENKVRKARLERQKREKARAERVSKVKSVWKHCKDHGIVLGRIPLVATVSDDVDEEDDQNDEARWNHHQPHSGRLPQQISGTEWSWPCLFVYPSHNQSDFIEYFSESEMVAIRVAEIFPELENEKQETVMPWDFNNEFVCSKLAIYFEVHCTEGEGDVVHPESVEKLQDQASAMRYYESSRALKGDEGPEMATVARCIERKHLHQQRKAWKKKHKSLWARPEPCPVVRVHPAVSLIDILQDERFVVPNFLVTLILFPEDHPAQAEFLKERRLIGMVEPKNCEL
jgi:tetratricopeptide (TPR) repeat protein